MTLTIDIASSSAEGIFFKASCAASLSCTYYENYIRIKVNKVVYTLRNRQITWSALTRCHSGGKSAKSFFTESSGGLACLKKECFNSFSAVGLFV